MLCVLFAECGPGLFLLYLWERVGRHGGTKGRKCSKTAGKPGHRVLGCLPWDQNIAIPKAGCLSTILDEVDRGTKKPPKMNTATKSTLRCVQRKAKSEAQGWAATELSTVLSTGAEHPATQTGAEPNQRHTSCRWPAPHPAGVQGSPWAGSCCPFWQVSSLGWWPCCFSQRHTATDPIYKTKKPKKHELTLPPFPQAYFPQDAV